MNLYEKYRPKNFDEVIGQDKAVRMIQIAIRNGVGGNSYWFSGASGTGKNAMGGILARMIADDIYITEFDSGDNIKVADIEKIEEDMRYTAWGKGGRAYIINEAHGMRTNIVRSFLGILERIPRHVCFIFTTTKEGQEKLFTDDIDAHPLISRCITISLTNQGLAKPFAEHCKRIAQAEGLDGKPISAYVKLLQSCKNNCRMALQKIQSGVMLN